MKTAWEILGGTINTREGKGSHRTLRYQGDMFGSSYLAHRDSYSKDDFANLVYIFSRVANLETADIHYPY